MNSFQEFRQSIKEHLRAIGPLRGHFETFIRTGHWGTCVDCPVVDGRKIPELCQHSKRFDHQLELDALVGQYRASLADRPIPRDQTGAAPCDH